MTQMPLPHPEALPLKMRTSSRQWKWDVLLSSGQGGRSPTNSASGERGNKWLRDKQDIVTQPDESILL
ncbi:hypothetical protein [Ktedonospora formicarum]|uniref:Uncharacterized protein n=1 Tax=Ktedonospora formicarum TaxID=2778364 RepID=A0A8J3MTQ2_9CHLR|nr:hypothetical protein [Ktedonospora formicarum]GHO47380.1 hypothetical protein KSX_55430 [Ktedonospora formicarum]